jgi:hypothetical protein
MKMTTTLESLRDALRNETSRWLGKAIGLVRDPHESYEQEVRELWRKECPVRSDKSDSRWN